MDCIGGLATYEKVYFAGLARRLCEAITLSQEGKESDLDVNDVEEYLREWLWCGEYKGFKTEAFWADFRVARESLEDAEGEEVIDDRRTGQMNE